MLKLDYWPGAVAMHQPESYAGIETGGEPSPT